MKRLDELLGKVVPKRDVVVPKPDCEICNDGGYVRRKRSLTDPLFGKSEPCVCQTEKGASPIFRSIGGMSIRQIHEVYSFALFKAPDDIKDKVQAYVESVEDSGAPGFGLLIQGEGGAGKTHLAASIAGMTKRSVCFAAAPDLFDQLRFSTSNDVHGYSGVVALVQAIDLLIVDDIGVVNATPWVQEKLFQILNFREAAGLPTVLVSDLSGEEWRRRYPQVLPRLQDDARWLKISLSPLE